MDVVYSLHEDPIPSGLAGEFLSLSETVFDTEDRLDGTWRLGNMPDPSAFTARSGGALVGFKLGYAVTSQRYYSWLGGVHPSYRRAGIARELMRQQHAWISARGYRVIESEVIQTNHGMSRLNEESGFVAAGIRFDADARIIYRKYLGEPDE